MTSRRHGFTLTEVLVAVAILLSAMLILASATTTALRSANVTDVRTHLASVMGFLGREVVGGDPRALPAVDAEVTWTYAALADAFPELANEANGLLDPAAYRASVLSDGMVDVVGAVAVRYEITVCTTTGTEERCLDAVTFGPAPTIDGGGSLLPGIN